MSYLYSYIFIHRPKLKHFIQYMICNILTRYIVYKIQNILCNYWKLSQHHHNEDFWFPGKPRSKARLCEQLFQHGPRAPWQQVLDGRFLTENDMVKPWETMGNHGKPLFNILKLPCHQGHLACTTFSGIALRKFAPKALGRTAASWTIMSSWRKFWGHRPSFMIQANYARKMHHQWGTNLNWVLQTTSSVRPHRENENPTWMTLYRTWPVKESIEETVTLWQY